MIDKILEIINGFIDALIAEIDALIAEVILKKVDIFEICIFVEILNTVLLNLESYRGMLTLLSRNLGRLNIILIVLSLWTGLIMSSLSSESDRFGFTTLMCVVLFGIIGIRRAGWR